MVDPPGTGTRLSAAGLRVALAVEDAWQAALVGLLGLLGRHRVTVLPFVGHGSPHRVHVRARVVLGSRALPAPQPEPVPGPGPAGGPRRFPWRTLRSSVGRFLTVELPRCAVAVEHPGGGRTTTRADREGYVDVVLDVPGLAPGWHELTLTASWRGHTAEVLAPLLVVDPASPYALVSDVDDTVIETGVTRGLELLRLTLLTEVTERVPLPGAAELYRALAGTGAPVFYLSTSPWNLHDLLARFIALRGFPRGPLLLTDWGPGRAGFLRIAAEEHKRALIRQVLEDHPGLGVVLVGDTGQIDPEIYAAVAAEAPGRVRAIYVRRTAGIGAARAAEVDALAARVTATGVPMLAVDDSTRIAEHATELGLLDPQQ